MSLALRLWPWDATTTTRGNWRPTPDGLLVHLLAGGAFLCAALSALTYGIVARIHRRFAVFG